MKKTLINEIEIPEGIEVVLEGTELKIKGPEGENIRKFKTPKIKIEKKENKIIIGSKNATKKEKRLMNTIIAHIKNMLKGVQEKFEYKLKICSSHFPMSVDISEKEIVIKNFLGEKIPRKATLRKNIEITKEGDFLSIKSTDKEKAGQSAASIERATKLRGRDRRVFQDGIYIINKPKEKLE